MHETKRKPRVVMVLEATFPVYGGGGAESQVLTLGKCLIERGVDVDVVVPMVANGPQIAQENVSGLRVTRISYPRVRLFGGVIMLGKLAWHLIKERRGYDFIHAHVAGNMAAIAALTGAVIGKRVLVKLTGMKEMVGGILDTDAGFTASWKRWAMQRGAILQATSTRIQTMLQQVGFARQSTLLLPNGVDTERFTSVGERTNLAALRQQLCGDARLVGVFVGRLAPEKGHELLLASWAKVMNGRSDTKLLLVGDGPKRDAVQSLAHELGIGGQVVFAGHSDDVAPFLRIADFGLLTSLAEGLSNSLLEYMASGLPVVGSRVSGTEDFVVPNETGWLFEPGDGASLELALRNAACAERDTLRELGRAAHRRIMSTASLEAVTDALIQQYQFGADALTPVREHHVLR
jgi:L-malate glycosyltransferase